MGINEFPLHIVQNLSLILSTRKKIVKTKQKKKKNRQMRDLKTIFHKECIQVSSEVNVTHYVCVLERGWGQAKKVSCKLFSTVYGNVME